MPSKKTKSTSEIAVEPPATTEATDLAKEGQEGQAGQAEATESPTSPTEKAPTSPTEKAPTSPTEKAPTSPTEKAPTRPTEKKPRRTSSSVTNVYKPEELKALIEEEGRDLKIAKEVSRLNWKMNKSPGTLDDWRQLKEIPISEPRVRKMHVFFSTGIHVTARCSPSSKVGVSVYDVLTAIHKLYKNKADDELDLPVLANIEWGRGEDLQRASQDWPAVSLAALKKEAEPTGKKAKK